MFGQGFVVIVDQIYQRTPEIQPHSRIDHDLKRIRAGIRFRQRSRFRSSLLLTNNLEIVAVLHVDPYRSHSDIVDFTNLSDKGHNGNKDDDEGKEAKSIEQRFLPSHPW